jgi:hypothetical protein
MVFRSTAVEETIATSPNSQGQLSLFNFFIMDPEGEGDIIGGGNLGIACEPVRGSLRDDGRFQDSALMPITCPTEPRKDPLSTSIDVLLLRHRWYFIYFQTEDFFRKTSIGNKVKVTIDKETTGREDSTFTADVFTYYINSNIPSYCISMRTRVIPDSQAPFMRVSYNQTLTDDEGKTFAARELDSNVIDDYINNYMEIEGEPEPKAKNGNWIEGLIGNLILFIGEVILRMMENALGLENGGLTTDKLIFGESSGTETDVQRQIFGESSGTETDVQRQMKPVVDLRPLGGIGQILGGGPNSLEHPVEGIFANGEVKTAVSAVYRALKAIAVVVYIILFVYVAIKILLAVGTPGQSKALKVLEYWLGGVVILNFAPYIFPAVPYLTNTLCYAIKHSSAVEVASQYSASEIAAALGSNVLVSEDAGAVNTRRILNNKIRLLREAQGGGYDTGRTIDENWDEVNSKIDLITSYMNDDSAKEEFRADMEKGKEYIETWFARYDGSNTTVLQIGSSFYTLARVHTANYYFSKIDQSSSSVRFGIYDWLHNEAQFADVYRELYEAMRNTIMQRSIEILENMRESLTADPMVALKITFKETDKPVYAIAWFMLMLQMFSIVFMYYKRVIVVTLLIVLFPIVMAVYVIDKVGDGKSQSLKTWIQEFIANCTIQLIHALVYISVVNIGIQICRISPERYWIFLFVAICSIFPCERILRGILGLKSSTLGELKFNMAGMIAATVAVRKTAKNGFKMGTNAFKGGGKLIKDIKKDGIKKVAGQRAKKFLTGDADKKKEEKDKKKKKKKERQEKVRDSRSKDRDYRIKAMEDSKKRLKEGHHHVKDYAAVVKGTKAEIGKKKEELANKIKNGRVAQAGQRLANSKLGKAAIKTGKVTSRAASIAGSHLKRGANLYKKFAGTAFGLVKGMEALGEGGFASGVVTARSQVHMLGGFKDQKLEKKKDDKEKQDDKRPNQLPEGYKPVDVNSEQQRLENEQQASQGGSTREQASQRLNDEREAINGGGQNAGQNTENGEQPGNASNNENGANENNSTPPDETPIEQNGDENNNQSETSEGQEEGNNEGTSGEQQGEGGNAEGAPGEQQGEGGNNEGAPGGQLGDGNPNENSDNSGESPNDSEETPSGSEDETNEPGEAEDGEGDGSEEDSDDSDGDESDESEESSDSGEPRENEGESQANSEESPNAPQGTEQGGEANNSLEPGEGSESGTPANTGENQPNHVPQSEGESAGEANASDDEVRESSETGGDSGNGTPQITDETIIEEVNDDSDDD